MTVYATAAELRAQPDMNSSDSDVVLGALLEAASRAIDAYCNRPDGFVAVDTAAARVYPGSGRPVQWIDECVSISLVEVKTAVTDSSYVEWSSGDWLAFSGEPRLPDYNRTPYQGVMVAPGGSYAVFTGGAGPTVRVTARWGYAATCPAAVQQACITLAARWYKRGKTFWSDAMTAPDGGVAMFRKALDPDVQFMLTLGRLVRPTIG